MATTTRTSQIDTVTSLPCPSYTSSFAPRPQVCVLGVCGGQGILARAGLGSAKHRANVRARSIKQSHKARSSAGSSASAGSGASTVVATSTSVTTTGGGVTTAVTILTSQVTVSAAPTPPISVAAPLCINKGFNYCLDGVDQALTSKCGRGNYSCFCRECNSGVRNCVSIGCSDQKQAQEYISAVNSQCSQGYGVPSAVNTAPFKGLSSSSGGVVSGGAIAGIVVGVVFALLLLLLVLWLLFRRKRKRNKTEIHAKLKIKGKKEKKKEEENEAAGPEVSNRR